MLAVCPCLHTSMQLAATACQTPSQISPHEARLLDDGYEKPTDLLLVGDAGANAQRATEKEAEPPVRTPFSGTNIPAKKTTNLYAKLANVTATAVNLEGALGASAASDPPGATTGHGAPQVTDDAPTAANAAQATTSASSGAADAGRKKRRIDEIAEDKGEDAAAGGEEAGGEEAGAKKGGASDSRGALLCESSDEDEPLEEWQARIRMRAAEREAEKQKKKEGQKKKAKEAKKGKTNQPKGAPPANKPKPKPKTYQPRVGDVVEARWMFGKKDQIEAGAGKSFCGKWYDAKVTAIDAEAQTASVVFDMDGVTEEGVLMKHIKLLPIRAPAPRSPAPSHASERDPSTRSASPTPSASE